MMQALCILFLKIGTALIDSIQIELHDASAVQFKDNQLERIDTMVICRKWRS